MAIEAEGGLALENKKRERDNNCKKRREIRCS
jgi:hypothetical protein